MEHNNIKNEEGPICQALNRKIEAIVDIFIS